MSYPFLKNSKKYVFLASAIIFIAFVFFSYLVAKEKFTKIDFDLTVKFQDKIPRRLDEPFSILSVIGSAEISMILWFILSIYLLIRRFWLSFLSMAILPIALSTEIFGKLFVFHPGPPFMFYRGVIDFHFPSEYIKTNYSYPSGHMLRTTFLATFLAMYFFYRSNQKVQSIAFPSLAFFIFLMMISRIYLGEHWTTDVIGGTLLGLSTALFSSITIPLKRKKANLNFEEDLSNN